MVELEPLAGKDVVVDRLLTERVPEGDELAVAVTAENALVERLSQGGAELGRCELGDLGQQLVVSGPADDGEGTDGPLGVLGEPSGAAQDDLSAGEWCAAC